MTNITIYHNPACGTLAQHAGDDPQQRYLEPEIILYLENPGRHAMN